MNMTRKRGIHLVCALVLLFTMLQVVPACQALAEQTGSGATGVYVKGPLMGGADDQEAENTPDELQAPAGQSVSETSSASSVLPVTGDGDVASALVPLGFLLITSVVAAMYSKWLANKKAPE